MAHDLVIERAQGDSTCDVLRLTGRIDARSASHLIEECRQTLVAGRHLVLNLAGVTFLSSSGIGTLLVLSERFDEIGKTVSFASASDLVRSSIELLSLETFLRFHDSEDEARRKLAA
jgi:anti-anti-sigma factor